MKTLYGSFILGLCLVPMVSSGQVSVSLRTAEISAQCLSIEFQPAYDDWKIYKLSMSTYDGAENGEVAPLPGRNYTHWSYVYLEDITGWDPVPGVINLDIPSIDANQNGVNDFFEVSQAILQSTSGAYSFSGLARGGLQVQWSRAAGSKTGTCVLDFGDLGAFSHRFTIQELTGTLDYLSKVDGVAADLMLKDSDGGPGRLTAHINFIRAETNRSDLIILPTGSWTNEANESLSFSGTEFWRDQTNYDSIVVFDDGRPSTSIPDYRAWYVRIQDRNDYNQNGIPDLTDTMPIAPKLSIWLNGGRLFLGVDGEAGRTYDLMRIYYTLPPPPIWMSVQQGTATTILPTNNPPIINFEHVQSFTLTNRHQVLEMPLGSTNRFWMISAPL